MNNINNKCPHCGSEIKDEHNSLHCWYIEYKCGYKMWGALDTKTHGNDIMIDKTCKIKSK